MLTKRPAPLTGKLKNSIMSGGFRDSSSVSRKNHSEYCKILSPRGLINYDLDGIGLGIVAAMEKYVDDGTQLPASKLFCRPDCNRSNPIPVKSPKKSTESRGVIIDENEENSLKDYTFVTGIIGNNNKTFDRDWENQRRDLDRRRSTKNNKPSMFIFSPVGFEDFTDYPDSDFLSSCHMCRKKLHGKDIYMYRGEKAFCSTECRYRQIKMDEKKKEEEEKAKEKEKFKGYEFGSRSVQFSSSSCNNNGRIFSPRILAI